jgi:glycosyltransferase involved in cell wall biosynthesis
MVSIIIPAYRTSQYIEECLDSIQNQNYFENNKNYEIIVGVDGCVETLNKMKEIKHKYRNLKIIYMAKNYGSFITFNTLLSLCTYDRIIKFDSDDMMLPTLITDVMDTMDIDADLVRFQCYEYSDENNYKKWTGHADGIVNGVYGIKKHVYEIFGGYQPWKCSADTEFLCRFSQYKKFKEVKLYKPMFYYRQHDQTLSRNLPMKEGSLRKEYQKKFKGKKYLDFFVKPIIGEFYTLK